MPPSAQTTKLQSTLRLLIPRLRLLQKKDTASSVSQRRELANLLENGREASARIRVENIIATDIAVEVMEMVELYCELLLARAAVLDQIAFASERGARARNKAKSAVKGEQGSGAGGAQVERSGGSRRGFGFFGGGGGGGGASKKQDEPSTTTTTITTTTPPGEGDNDEEEDSYIDPGLDEAAAAIFYAWPRFPREVRELTTLRALLIERWGKDFAALAQDNKTTIKVPERLVKGLKVRPPSKELVESYLREIAKAYGVAWPKEEYDEQQEQLELQKRRTADEVEVPELLDAPPPGYDDFHGHGVNDDGDDGDDGLPLTPQPKSKSMTRTSDATEALSKATPPRDIGPHDASGRSPVSVAPPGPRSDNPNPRVKIPGSADTATADREESQETKSSVAPTPAPKKIPEMDELARRFAALKR
ncbi:hypothetical protein VTN00DRAFT_9379 [Thermoascus crustaceus]|uniref:uncharacterized protein n=1 Tax=Thermoascus crustaceus TaxID=5088 RepID=UPI003742CE61